MRPQPFWVVTLWRSRGEGHGEFWQDTEWIVAVCLEPSVAHQLAFNLTQEVERFLVTARAINDRAQQDLQVSIVGESVDERSDRRARIVEDRNRHHRRLVSKLTDWRWNNPHVLRPVLFENARWSYQVRHAFDDPTEVIQ